VPSKDYSRWPPCFAAFLSEGRQTETEQQNKKKTMKTYTIQKSGLQSRSEQLNKAYAKHRANRELPMQSVLNFLKTRLPQQYQLAEIVGKWVWLEFPKRRTIANALWYMGFHWNQRRNVWQHPCGACAPFASHPQDPRIKYGSYFAAERFS